jgi:hypothetical protein
MKNDAARDVSNDKDRESRDRCDREEWEVERLACEDALHIARCYAFAVYTAARAQGHYVRSYAFDYNATRELIANNMD